MSGGYFNYIQCRIPDEVINPLKDIIHKKNDEEHYLYNFSPAVVKELKTGLDFIERANIYIQRIDWLVEGDDGEDTFLERLKEDLEQYEKVGKLQGE
jgi:hypothetical protein